ncbi:MAG: hypothetical protein HYS12_22635 [Planctomycetes bacterium]|nr:hypothetical protein [Planctomycetota bacterium]
MRRGTILAVTGLLLAALPCPFVPRLAAQWRCSLGFWRYPPQTFREQVKDATAVLYGTLTRATPDNPVTGTGDGITDLVIDKGLVIPPSLKGRTTITLDNYVPTDGKTKYVLCCEVFKGKIHAYRGIPVYKNSDLPTYIAGILKVRNEKPAKRLRFYFDYLNHAEDEIANDALHEFRVSDYKDYRELAGHLPGDRLAAWLRDPKTPVHRIGPFARLLGHCSKNKEQDGQLLRKLLDEPLQTGSFQSGLDGVLEGLLLLQPKTGWQDICKLMEDESTDFQRRYVALRAVRFVKEYRPDLVPSEQLIKEVAVLLDQKDIVDLAIEDFRRWKRWELSQRILTLRGREGYDLPIIQRAILRFALSSPDPAAKRFVEEQRKRDPQSIKDSLELLKIEQGK